MKKQYNSPEIEVIEAQLNAYLLNGASLVDENGWVEGGVSDEILGEEF